MWMRDVRKLVVWSALGVGVFIAAGWVVHASGEGQAPGTGPR